MLFHCKHDFFPKAQGACIRPWLSPPRFQRTGRPHGAMGLGVQPMITLRYQQRASSGAGPNQRATMGHSKELEGTVASPVGLKEHQAKGDYSGSLRFNFCPVGLRLTWDPFPSFLFPISPCWKVTILCLSHHCILFTFVGS